MNFLIPCKYFFILLSVFKVWIEDKTSIRARIDLVNEYDLAGVASWSKTFETPDTWEYIEAVLE